MGNGADSLCLANAMDTCEIVGTPDQANPVPTTAPNAEEPSPDQPTASSPAPTTAPASVPPTAPTTELDVDEPLELSDSQRNDGPSLIQVMCLVTSLVHLTYGL